MRITALTNGRDSYKLKHFLDTLSQLFIALVAVIVDLQNFKDLIFHSQHRIQAGHRILKDHRDLLAADAPHFILFQFQKVLSVKENLSSFYLADSVRQKPHDCLPAPVSPSYLPGGGFHSPHGQSPHPSYIQYLNL